MASAISLPVFARAFPAMSRALEAGRIAGHRKDLLAGPAQGFIDTSAADRCAAATGSRRRMVCLEPRAAGRARRRPRSVERLPAPAGSRIAGGRDRPP
jgi:hypothetical protein